MRYIPRQLETPLKKAAKLFPAIILTGPRRAGKTTMLRRAFPKAAYYLLEDPDLLGRVRSDPRSFLESAETPVILDEIQNTPELFSYVRARIDKSPRKRPGQWILTGSQDAALMRGVTESMAGRAAVFDLLPLSRAEAVSVGVLSGGYPEVLAAPRQAETWFRSYVQTYLERDVRQLSAVRDLATFRRFLALLASLTGQMVNRADLAGALGMSVPTISTWLGILEATKQILLVPPYFENFGKRLVKSPKLYFTDSGLTCHLLGIFSESDLRKSVFAGPVFEGFVASEIVKQQLGAGHRQELYYFRDRQGLEVDFLIPRGSGRVTLLEAKASRTVRPEMAQSMQRLSKAMARYQTSCAVVHWPSKSAPVLDVLAPGVRAVPVDRLADAL
jgi:predicted AAA+ superfamily ATPase